MNCTNLGSGYKPLYDLVLGVDGGGTHSKIVAVDFSGNVLATEEFGNLNYNSDTMEVCRDRLLKAVHSILKKTGKVGYDFLSIGISSLQKEATEDEKKAFLGDSFDLQKVLMQPDVYMTLSGASLGKPEVMIISGTGAMGIAKNRDGHVFTRGGYGYLIDSDKGSSYHIAMNGIIAVINEHENIGEKTSLTQLLLKQFELSCVENIVQVVYSPDYHVSKVATFAKEVIRAALQKDKVAEGIVENCVDALVEFAIALANEINEKACGINVYGGLFQYNKHIFDLFEQKIKVSLPDCNVKFPMFKAEIGAVIEFFLQQDLLTVELLENLKKSSKRSE